MSTGRGASDRRRAAGGVHNTRPAPVAAADPPRSPLRLAGNRFSGSHVAGSLGRRAVLIALFGSVTTMVVPALAATGPEMFGPGKVACQRLGADRFDCLLTSLRVSGSANGVATFSLASLPKKDRAILRRWCFAAADDCTVTIGGVRQYPQGSRLSSVTSVRWTRLKPPRDQAAAVARTVQPAPP